MLWAYAIKKKLQYNMHLKDLSKNVPYSTLCGRNKINAASALII